MSDDEESFLQQFKGIVAEATRKRQDPDDCFVRFASDYFVFVVRSVASRDPWEPMGEFEPELHAINQLLKDSSESSEKTRYLVGLTVKFLGDAVSRLMSARYLRLK